MFLEYEENDTDEVSISSTVHLEAITTDVVVIEQHTIEDTRELLGFKPIFRCELDEDDTWQFDTRYPNIQYKEGYTPQKSAERLISPLPQASAQLLSHSHNVFVRCRSQNSMHWKK